ncbi:receptor-like protein kinase, partial [Trifolium medium]|nr:receptor-like protein kinase [Trifolium medium]
DNIPVDGTLNVTVNCSCGNKVVSKDYGLFITYPLTSKNTLESIAKDTEIEADLLQRFNPGVNFNQGSGLVFIPGKVGRRFSGVSGVESVQREPIPLGSVKSFVRLHLGGIGSAGRERQFRSKLVIWTCWIWLIGTDKWVGKNERSNK